MLAGRAEIARKRLASPFFRVIKGSALGVEDEGPSLSCAGAL
jgi:hypothetical protein